MRSESNRNGSKKSSTHTIHGTSFVSATLLYIIPKTLFTAPLIFHFIDVSVVTELNWKSSIFTAFPLLSFQLSFSMGGPQDKHIMLYSSHKILHYTWQPPPVNYPYTIFTPFPFCPTDHSVKR